MSRTVKTPRAFVMKCVIDAMVLNLFPSLDRVLSGSSRSKRKASCFEYAESLKCSDCRDYKRGSCKGKRIVGLATIIEKCIEVKARRFAQKAA